MALTLMAIAVSSFVVALSGATQPGPMFFATIAGSRRHGFWYGPTVILGHAAAEILALALLLLGLTAFLANPWVVITIAWVGAATLLWMAASLLRQSRRPPPEVAEGGGTSRWGATVTGFLTSVLNPFWYLWWITQGAVLLVSAAEFGWPGVVAFFIGHIAADFAWYSLTSFGISRGRKILQGRVYQGLMIGCAVFLLVMAVLFVRLALVTI